MLRAIQPEIAWPDKLGSLRLHGMTGFGLGPGMRDSVPFFSSLLRRDMVAVAALAVAAEANAAKTARRPGLGDARHLADQKSVSVG